MFKGIYKGFLSRINSRYEISRKTNDEYWVLNPDGDLVYRATSLEDARAYVRMQEGLYA